MCNNSLSGIARRREKLLLKERCMKRVRHNWLLIIGVIVFLFAQFTVSVYACPMAGDWVAKNGKVCIA